jgi:hypothetical protein
VAVSGLKRVWIGDLELHGYFKPFTCLLPIRAKETSFPNQCNYSLEERVRNIIREKTAEEPTGKIGIMQQRWEAVTI